MKNGSPQKYIIGCRSATFHFSSVHLVMGLVYFRELNKKTKFAIWKIEENANSLLDFLKLDEKEWNTLKNLNKGKRTLHWLATRALLRTLLSTHEHISCISDGNGKPYLPDFEYKISLTHSYEYAGAILSTQGECGIDLELIKEKVVRIKEKFLQPQELDFAMTGPHYLEKLYACWCAKEAVYKLQGNKGISFLHNITIAPFDYQPQGVLTAYLNSDDKQQRFHVYYEKFNDYMLGYVVE